ncbi:hypothetical protein [Escherichia coli]|uniref:hypothetical protein n=1 Tax=Escherichia coli TaxID=562 RepID=UPI0020CF97A5|nr:hypothetical protein [Escherichia coli]
MTDFGGKTSIFSHPVYLFLREFSLQDFRGGSREAYELFMEKRFGDLVDRRRAKNGDNEYMAWDMTLGWIVWQQRAGIHFSTMSQQEVK